MSKLPRQQLEQQLRNAAAANAQLAAYLQKQQRLAELQQQHANNAFKQGATALQQSQKGRCLLRERVHVSKKKSALGRMMRADYLYDLVEKDFVVAGR